MLGNNGFLRFFEAVFVRMTATNVTLIKSGVSMAVARAEGDNNRRKAKAWLSKGYLDKARDLKTGEFLHQYGSRITYYDLRRGRIETCVRDFYDFVTKIWALNSELEEEEMSETHTPFTVRSL
ncbi:hypothetical protein ES702_02993 [subsurface metagenome]